MNERKKHSPSIETLGRDCAFWSNGTDLNQAGCLYPKFELQGRKSCEGIIDDVCLWQLTGRRPRSLSENQMQAIKTTPPSLTRGNSLPPGDTKA